MDMEENLYTNSSHAGEDNNIAHILPWIKNIKKQECHEVFIHFI